MKTRARLFIYVLLLSAFSPWLVCADIGTDINRIVSQPSQAKVEYGIHIVEAKSGKAVYSRNAHRRMVPASNMKLITSAAALHYLSSDYVYETVFAMHGNTLIIIGSGDPLFGDYLIDTKYGRQPGWLLDKITEALIANDVKHIDDIVVDTTIFDDMPTNPNWPASELNRWYACEVSGLNYNGNCVEMTCRNNSGGIDINIKPETKFIKTINKVRAINSGGGAVGAYRTEQMNTLLVRGRCRRQQGPFRVAIERPAMLFVFVLAEHLAKNNISVTGNAVERSVTNRSGLKIITAHQTPIGDCLARCNKDSFGLAAESLLKTIAANANKNRNGSWAAGNEMVSKYLISIGIGPGKFNCDDGSGLSRNNKLTPKSITTVIRAMYKSQNWQHYKDSLAAGGVDGTIKKYFKEPQYKGRVLGKTGYINGIKSFSGYCRTDQGEYIFSIITDHANGKTRAVINDIAKAIMDNNAKSQ